MISDQNSIQHLGVVDGTRHSVPLYIIRGAKIFLQLLKDLNWLGLLNFVTKLVIHFCQHYASDSSPIRTPLQTSVPDQTLSTGRRDFGCQIHYHIKDPLVLQDNPQLWIPAIEIRILQLFFIEK